MTPNPPPGLTIRGLSAVGVDVPMTYALGTSRATMTRAPLLLIDLETEEGVTGRAYLFCYLREAAVGIAEILREVLRVTKGERVAPAELWGRLYKRFTLTACRASSGWRWRASTWRAGTLSRSLKGSHWRSSSVPSARSSPLTTPVVSVSWRRTPSPTRRKNSRKGSAR